MSDKKVTIVTVCFNCESSIQETMASVLRQSSNQYEFIIIDGQSTDNTLSIIKKCVALFEDKHIQLKFISEKDEGIYNAMNKGLSLSTCEWIYFLNSGDTFYSDTVIETVLKAINNFETADVVYGSINTQCLGQQRISYPRELAEFNKKMPFCHQGVFAKRELLLKYPFDEKYTIIADYKMFYELYLQKYVFKKLDIIIANYSLRGRSSGNSFVAYKESINMKNELGVDIDPINIRLFKYLYHYILDKVGKSDFIKKIHVNNMFKRGVL